MEDKDILISIRLMAQGSLALDYDIFTNRLKNYLILHEMGKDNLLAILNVLKIKIEQYDAEVSND